MRERGREMLLFFCKKKTAASRIVQVDEATLPSQPSPASACCMRPPFARRSLRGARSSTVQRLSPKERPQREEIEVSDATILLPFGPTTTPDVFRSNFLLRASALSCPQSCFLILTQGSSERLDVLRRRQRHTEANEGKDAIRLNAADRVLVVFFFRRPLCSLYLLEKKQKNSTSLLPLPPSLSPSIL